jgi:hypothetical protein
MPLIKRAARVWLQSFPVFLGFTILNIVVSRPPHQSSTQIAIGLLGLSGLWYLGSCLWVLLAPLRTRRHGFLGAWVVCGAVVCGVAAGVLSVLDEPVPEVTTLVWWVAFWVVVGAITGYAYGRVAQDWLKKG